MIPAKREITSHAIGGILKSEGAIVSLNKFGGAEVPKSIVT